MDANTLKPLNKACLMRTRKEQHEGLKKVAKRLGKAICNYWIIDQPGDVVAIRVIGPERIEAVYADRGYDIWGWGKNGNLTILNANLSEDDAALVLITAYKEHKIDVVMQRIGGPQWRQKVELKAKADYVSEQVWGQTREGYPNSAK